MSEASTLHRTDFFAWTREQAARLRALPPEARGNGVDIENVAEEIEGLGGSQRSAVRSQMRNIAYHLLKLEFLPGRMPHGHWRREIRGFRGDLDQELRDSPSLRQHLDEMYLAAWRRAADDLARDINEEANTRRVLARLGLSEGEPRYDLDRELLNPDWFPSDPYADDK
jgi:hypothetical protein